VCHEESTSHLQDHEFELEQHKFVPHDGRGVYSWTHLSHHQISGSECQLHVPAFYNRRYPLYKRLRGSQSRCECSGVKVKKKGHRKNLSPCLIKHSAMKTCEGEEL
jgi:hypothetical protein